MRNLQTPTILTLALVFTFAPACSTSGSSTADVPVSSFRPTLPPVPTLPPPPHPPTYPDGTYSVYGLRRRIRQTVDTNVRVKAYIVNVYQPPECPRGRSCPPARMPHVWIADEAQQADPTKRLRVTGYAENQRDVAQAIADAKRGRAPRTTPESEGLPPIPTDFEVGRQFAFEGRFSRMSGNGFLDSDGLIDYRGHGPADAPAAAPAPGTAPAKQP